MIEKQYKTLINELDDIVDKKHINQVKKVIEDLTRINDFKGELLHTLDIDTVYKKITIFLSTNFRIFNYKVVQNIHNIEEIKFQSGNKEKYTYTFAHSINEIGHIEFFLDNDHLESFDKVYLNTFLDEITSVLYMKYVLSELQNSIYVDHLTKLKNRQSFDEDMKGFIPLALREKMHLGVLIVNIDRFRAVNDEHGTKFGDDFLRLYASVIKEVIRSSDIAVRFGGGEFLVVLVNVLDEDKALEIAQKIKERLTETYLITSNNDHFKKTVCIGVSMFPQDSSDINEVIKKAEMALVDARDKGRNNIVRFIEPDNGEIDLF
ncbi:MAG: GGDEF domain-containing protein [Arcobacteraceae bacterium]|jgi:diguanylate cyclase (GGDEF)-like protein|nr:GGDEF domain-containing protein [Arcobacteraceae bacterium]